MPATTALHRTPWHLFRRGHHWLRTRFFSVPRPEHEILVVDIKPDPLRQTLGGDPHNFEPGRWLSYEYQHECVNLRQPVRIDEPEYPDLVWRQLHVRGFEREDGRLDLDAHFEPSPQEHPKAHIQQTALSVHWGRTRLARILDDVGIDYEREQYDRPRP